MNRNIFFVFNKAYYHTKFCGIKGLLFALKRALSKKKLIKYKSKCIPHPLYLRNRTSDVAVFHQIFYDEDYNIEYGIPPKIIVDCGANIGLSAIFFSLKFPNAKIFAIEPDKENYNLMLKNIENYPNIIPINKGIWNKNTYLETFSETNSNWDIVVNETSQQTSSSISAITIQDLIKQYSLSSIDILKIDIEGAERKIFDANNDLLWLNKTKLIVIELHDNMQKGCSKAFFSSINQFNYRINLKGENIFCFLNDDKT